MKPFMLTLALVVVCCIGATAQFHYAFYYDLTGGQNVELNISNPMFETSSFVLSVYDAYGTEILTLSESLDSADTGYLVLGDRVPNVDYAWGVVVIDSTDRLIIGLEYYKDDELVSVDSVVTPVPELNPNEVFYLGAYYSQVGLSETAFIVMNPWSMTTTCTVTAYNREGYNVYSRDFMLSPYESDYVNLTDVIGSGTSLWGLLDVTMHDRAVILALEYSGRGCSRLEVDNVTEFYY
ncbi:hypothetical protein KAT84_03540 [Candidatus Bipolaricaulota bacterium]|nr:hypothetical protein [Candidatus Bipolaricaulota bacterium]